MEAENLLLIGLTLFLALLGGAALRRRSRESGQPLHRSERGEAAELRDVPEQSDVQHHELRQRNLPLERAAKTAEISARAIILAVSSTAGKLGTNVADTGTADDLLVRGSHWWAGTREEWDRTVDQSGWIPAAEFPHHENSVIVVSFELSGDNRDVPASRLSAAMLLRQTAKRDGVRVGEYYAIPPGVALGPLGFKR